MQLKFHYVTKSSPHMRGFVIDITLPRSSRFDPLELFGEEQGVEVSSKNGTLTTHYRLGISDNHQFARMLTTLWSHQEARRPNLQQLSRGSKIRKAVWQMDRKERKRQAQERLRKLREIEEQVQSKKVQSAANLELSLRAYSRQTAAPLRVQKRAQELAEIANRAQRRLSWSEERLAAEKERDLTAGRPETRLCETTIPRAPQYSGELAIREKVAQEEIARKRKRVAPLFNKGAYGYITDETDPTTIGRK